MNEYQPDKPLQEVFEDWRDCNPRVNSAETVRLMRLSVERWEEFLGRPALTGDFTERNVNGFRKWRAGVGRSKATIERESSKLLTLWRWAAKRGWAPEPLISIPKAPPPIPEAWNRRELARIFKAADQHSMNFHANWAGKPGQIPGGLVMGALLRLLFDTGERISATFQVKWADVDLDNRFVTFRSTTRKGCSKDNGQRFGRKTRRALLALKTFYESQGYYEADGPVFPPVCRTNSHYHLRSVLEDADVPRAKRVGFHQFRRSHATALYLVGGDPTYSLGHESSKMTHTYYLDPRQIRANYASDLLSGGIVGPIKRMFRRAKAAFGLW